MSTRQTMTLAACALALTITGCATSGRNYQTDIDALNAKVAALQGQLSQKDSEISRLNDQVGSNAADLERARREKAQLEGRLDDALSKLKSAPAPAPKPAAPDSDLK
ncbi:MAG: hypothetical protein MOGMAGMI_00773 [Candidatus Omnitrophica bacterium]|nr:hypothetical protein [Candidatus Omnitrophota bacterium]